MNTVMFRSFHTAEQASSPPGEQRVQADVQVSFELLPGQGGMSDPNS